ADRLVDGPRTATEVAAACGVEAGHLGRGLRFLAPRGVCRGEEAGAFHLPPAAGLLRSDNPVALRSLVLLFTDDLYWRPAGRLDDAVAGGGTVFDAVFGGHFFDHLPRDEERAGAVY